MTRAGTQACPESKTPSGACTHAHVSVSPHAALMRPQPHTWRRRHAEPRKQREKRSEHEKSHRSIHPSTHVFRVPSVRRVRPSQRVPCKDREGRLEATDCVTGVTATSATICVAAATGTCISPRCEPELAHSPLQSPAQHQLQQPAPPPLLFAFPSSASHNTLAPSGGSLMAQ